MNRHIDLFFQGYTWDEYFYVIGNRSGILIVYRGGLDSEGAVKLDEIVLVEEAEHISTIYESEKLKEIRVETQLKGVNDRLFFSYAEVDDSIKEEVTKQLRYTLCPIDRKCDINNNINNRIKCKGACALFPKELIES